MFALRTAAATRSFSARAFSTTRTRASDLCKLTIIGHLARNPELRLTRNDKEFVCYTVSTKTTLPPTSSGERPPPLVTFHKILCFNPSGNKFLSTLTKGQRVYVEANFELREPEPGADSSTPRGQRQIFLKHEMLKVLTFPQKVEPKVDVEAEAAPAEESHEADFRF